VAGDGDLLAGTDRIQQGSEVGLSFKRTNAAHTQYPTSCKPVYSRVGAPVFYVV